MHKVIAVVLAEAVLVAVIILFHRLVCRANNAPAIATMIRTIFVVQPTIKIFHFRKMAPKFMTSMWIKSQSRPNFRRSKFVAGYLIFFFLSFFSFVPFCFFFFVLFSLTSVFIENIAMKTRRSNSLTTGGMKPYDQYLAANFTSSSENLVPSQKQRSFSLSVENPRLLKTSSGSETRLDDLKPAYQAFQSQHTGMKYVGHWLKKLRLHKYCQAFEEMTFEQMMMLNESYLERLGITQGARTKMVNSIQKLKERHARLMQAEQDLKSGNTTIEATVQMLTELADTPMKPINAYDKCNVAAQFLNVLNLGE